MTIGVEMTTVPCNACGGVFAIAQHYHDDKRQRGGWIYCPYCRGPLGWEETEIQRLQRALDAKKRREEFLEAAVKSEREEREAAERRVSAQKAVSTRMKNRIAKGICPCCKRNFVDLHRHMSNKHPDFTNEAVETK